MQSVYVYYVDLLNDMKTTVKTFWISMLLILTCSISGKAVDFAQIGVKSAEACKASATLSSCSSTSSKKIKQENSRFADISYSWTTDVELGTKPISEIYSSHQQRIRRVIEDNIFLRNIFLIFGIVAIVVMLCTFDMEYDELLANLRRAGIWLPAVIGLWVIIYLFNTLSWYIIIRDGKKGTPIPFWKVYKLTVSGFALNYATPVGLMGGEPYRIMELTPYVGASKATSSVILYVMMHIFSHFCFWLFSIFLYLALRPVDFAMGMVLSVVGFFCLLAIYFFMKGYRNGMAVRTLKLLQHIPFIKGWAKRFSENKRETLERVDSQIAELHQQRKSTFYASLSLEFMARVLGCLEVYFILNILTTDVSFPACILIMAFTSLFANLFFFSPMQLGAREGGFALAVGGLAIPGAFGVYTGLITRVRELIWIVIGVLLMKVGNGTPANK